MWTAQDAQNVGMQVGELGLRQYEHFLTVNQKIVSEQTLRSIHYVIAFTEQYLTITFRANINGLFWIERGKRANTKLPVTKVGGRFELVENLKQWKEQVGFDGGDFVLARTIARNPRAPLPISQFVSEAIRQDALQIARNLIGRQFMAYLTSSLTQIYQRVQ